MGTTKRLIALTAIGLFVIGAVFAGGDTEETATESGDTIYTYVVQDQHQAPEDGAVVVQYMEDRWNVRFEWDTATDYDQLLNLRLAADEVPDVIRTRRNATRHRNLNNYGLARLEMAEIEQFMPRFLAHAENFTTDLEATLRETSNEFGDITYLPFVWHFAAVPRDSIMWRKDMLDELGFDVPTTIAEVTAVFAAYKERWPDRYPYSIEGNEIEDAGTLVFSAFGFPKPWYMYEEGQIEYGWVRPEAKLAIGVLRDWYAAGYIDPEFPTYMDEDTEVQFYVEGENIVSDHGGRWLQGVINNMSIDEPFEIVHGPYLIEAGYPQRQWSRGRTVMDMGVGFGRQLEENRDKMHRWMEMIEYNMMDPTESLIARFGIEGEHWTMGDDGLVNVAEGLGTRSYEHGFGVYWNIHAAWHYPETIDRRILQQTVDVDQTYCPEGCIYTLDRQKIHEQHVVTMRPPGGVLYDESENVLEFPDLEVLTQAMFVEIVRGDRPLDYWDEYVELWMDRGGRAMTEATNRQGLEYWENWTP